MPRTCHVATLADREQARATGSDTISTRGRTRAQTSFLHAGREDRWEAGLDGRYADVVEPLALLVVDTDRVGLAVVDAPVPGEDALSDVYGALDPQAVVEVPPLGRSVPPARGGRDAAGVTRAPSATS